MCRKIQCDGKFKKFCKLFWKLNKAFATQGNQKRTRNCVTSWVAGTGVVCIYIYIYIGWVFYTPGSNYSHRENTRQAGLRAS